MFVSHSAMILALTLLLNAPASSIGIIGGSDGPTAVYVSGCTVMPCKDDKPKDAEIMPFQAGSDYSLSAIGE